MQAREEQSHFGFQWYNIIPSANNYWFPPTSLMAGTKCCISKLQAEFNRLVLIMQLLLEGRSNNKTQRQWKGRNSGIMLPQTLAMSSFGWFPKEWPLQITASFLGFFWFISCFQQWVKCCFLLSFCTGYCLFSSPQYLLDLADTLTFYRGAGMCEEGNKPQALLLKGQCLLQKQGAEKRCSRSSKDERLA